MFASNVSPGVQVLNQSVKIVESVGRKLQQARLAKKLEIEDVAEKTKDPAQPHYRSGGGRVCSLS